MPKIVCFGEVLWDVFPAQKKVGGAPLNVALRLQSLNNEVIMVSCVGDDAAGKTLLGYIFENGLDTSCIQTIKEVKTGEVLVQLNDKGSATYQITFPCAWDFIQINENTKSMVSSADAFVFGSLAARHQVSKKTLFTLLEFARFKVFDLNLRHPFYSQELLIALMNTSDFIKLNDEELMEVIHFYNEPCITIEQQIKYLSKVTNTKHICVTKGKHGAVLLYNNKFYYNSGYPVMVKDTVGAGDSFLGALVNLLIKNANPQDAIDFACAVGALVAQSEGANPALSQTAIFSLINSN